MIPNFALSLSFDGIALLQRVPDGWHLVGEVPLDVPDLKAALADLRRTAVRIAPDGLRTKLVIPGDQIRFMSLDTEQASQSDVETALEGTTPYTLDELVIDFTRNGGQTHIAAVARETLDEAEAFAREHGFDPVACVAVPEPGTFATEVFLTALGGSGAVRDDRPVRQTGTVRLPAEPAKTPEAGHASATADATPSEVEPQTEAAPVAMAGPVAKAPDGDAAEAPRNDDTPVFASRSKVAAPTLKGGAQGAKPDTAMAAAALPGGVAPARLR
ncbi:MAG: hypothetical protein KKB02_17595, partial [Alphaproteobacteria bacterium]|nr:hypothetical protein [Alphaproteobacteria bacterium]